MNIRSGCTAVAMGAGLLLSPGCTANDGQERPSPSGGVGLEEPFADTTRFVSRDSGGVELIESRDSLWRGDGWTVDTATVILSIGSVEGDTSQALMGIKGAVRLSDGGIAIAESNRLGTGIKIFDPQARVRHRVGRRGEGPGEFTNISVLAVLPGDSLAVVDDIARRVSVFAPDGTLARLTQLRGLPPGWPLLKPFAPGGLVGAFTVPSSASRAPEPVAVADSIAFIRMDTSAGTATTLFLLPGAESVVLRDVTLGHPFSNSTFWTVSGDRILAASNITFGIGEYDANGRPLRVLRAPVMDIPLHPDSMETVRERWRRGPQNAGDAAEARYNDANLRLARFPKYLPLARGVLDDDVGNIWIRMRQTEDLMVFDHHGRLLGTVVLPGGRRAMYIGNDWMLVGGSDSLGVEFVEILRLAK